MQSVKCKNCGVPAVRGVDSSWVHDATLSQLRVTPAEFEAVLVNAQVNATLPENKRRYNALHRVVRLKEGAGSPGAS